MSTPTITEFLLARITEDEAVARAATPGPWEWEGDYPKGHCPHGTEWTDHGPDLVTVARVPDYEGGPMVAAEYVITAAGYDASSLDIKDADAGYIVHWDPARVLAECAAKRAIIEAALNAETYGDQVTVLRAVASVYAAHPDYRQEWL